MQIGCGKIYCCFDVQKYVYCIEQFPTNDNFMAQKN